MGEELDSWVHDGRDRGLAAEEGKNHENEKECAVPAHNGLIFICQIARKKSKDNFLAIERSNRDQIENGQADVGKNQGDEEDRERVGKEADEDGYGYS